MWAFIPGLMEMIGRGYVVAATDYPGLGTRGVHPFLIGASEGHAVIDSVRAAGNMAATAANDRFVVWGHSQGGHSALYAGDLARSYAPELKLLGVSAAAPASELAPLFEADINSAAGRILSAYVLWSWSKLFNIPLDTVLHPSAAPTLEQMVTGCIEAINEAIVVRLTEQPLDAGPFLKVDVPTVEPWRSLIARNTPTREPRDMPVFIAQGTADEIVRPAITVDFVQELCRGGTNVRSLELPDVTHTSIAGEGAAAAVDWMHDRFAGAPPPSDCGAR